MMFAENGIEEDPMVNWMTQQFVNDIFPDLRSGAYKGAFEEEDNLGAFKPIYSKHSTNGPHTLIKKTYNHNHYVYKHVK